jgi:glyoxylate reductase
MEDRTIMVFATADIGDVALNKLRERSFDVEVYAHAEPPPRSLIIEKVAGGVDALITTLRDHIDEEVFAAGQGRLKIVAQIAVGTDNIDLDAARRYGVKVTNTPNVLTEATAEFALFMLGALSRRLYSSEELVRENWWTSWHPYHPFLGDEVTGKTVSVIGAGRIGRAFAAKCVGLDVDLRLVNTGPPDTNFVDSVTEEMALRNKGGFSRELRTIEYVPLEAALESGDYVSLHVPLVMPGQSDSPTYHLIDDAAFSRMKRTAYLINTSRGAVVDERALYDSLVNDVIAGAALDVYEVEPLPPDSPLRDPKLKDRLRLFHHFASGTKETRLSADPRIGMAGLVVQAVIDALG